MTSFPYGSIKEHAEFEALRARCQRMYELLEQCRQALRMPSNIGGDAAKIKALAAIEAFKKGQS